LKNYSDTLKAIICLTVFFIVGVIEFMLVLAVTCIGKYYRTTVLRGVRKILELNENDEIEWVLENDRIVVRKGCGSRG